MYDDLMSRLDDSLTAIGCDVGTLHEGLKQLDMPQPVRNDAEQVWSEFFWTWKDVREEEVDLRDKLAVAAGQGSRANAAARVSMDWMSTWLRETLESGDALVSRLDEISRQDPALGGVYRLMAEFQADVARAHDTMEAVLGELGSRLDALGSAPTPQE